MIAAKIADKIPFSTILHQSCLGGFAVTKLNVDCAVAAAKSRKDRKFDI